MITEYMALAAERKTQLLSQTAARMGVDPVIVEKDLWVSAILGILFSHPETKDRFIGFRRRLRRCCAAPT